MLKERLIGAWELVSFASTLPDGRTVSPLGRGAHGTIVYAQNGLVSVNLARADRPSPGADKLFSLRADGYVAAAARGYMAYAGRFEVDEERALAIHHFDMCIDPSLIGTVQERHIRLFDDKLELSVIDPPQGNGVDFPSTLLWRRL
jgi:hypothetical protein